MRLVRVRADRVGPLRSFELSLEPGLNLVYGRNEAGKTALLDFIVSQLFRREGRRGARLSTVMRGVDRFADSREGQVELRRDDEVLVYPGAPSLLQVLGLGYPGLSGLFCVRSGEMEWPEKEEGEFWAALKKLLSGLPEGVETLRREAHRVAGLTETGRRMDREDRPLLTRYRETRRRARRLEELRERLPEARSREEEIARLEGELERLDRARRARVAELRRRLGDARAELEELADVPAGELDRWRELSVRTRERREQVEELEERLPEAREARRERAEEAARLKERAGETAGRRDRLEEGDLVERAREHVAAGAASGKTGRRSVRLVAAAGVVVAAALAAASLADLVPWAVGVAGALAGGTIAAWLGIRHQRASRQEEHRRRAARLLEKARRLELAVEEVGEIPAAAEELRRAAGRAGQAVEVQEVELRHAADRVEELREALESARSEHRAAREEMEELAGRLDAPSLAEAEARRERRQDVEGRARTLEGALAELAGPDPDDWDVQPPPDADELPQWDADRRARIDGELEEARRKYRALRDEFVEASLATPEDALTELQECRREMERMERDWAAGRLAGEVFTRMDESLERRLSDVLAAEGPFSASGVVERVTGRYVSVSRADGEGLVLRDREGRSFPLAELSRGTRDQVYLALRIGLGEAALESAGIREGGFLLLDDAFLTADWPRRERLVSTAADLAETGWQLVYLTCDRHLKGLFVDAGAALHELS